MLNLPRLKNGTLSENYWDVGASKNGFKQGPVSFFRLSLPPTLTPVQMVCPGIGAI